MHINLFVHGNQYAQLVQKVIIIIIIIYKMFISINFMISFFFFSNVRPADF